MIYLEHRVSRLLLVTTATLLIVCVALLAAWLLERDRQVRLDELSEREQRLLLDRELDQVGTVFLPAEFDPRMAYTLRRDADIDAWGSRFRSNELGFRAGAVRKAPDRFRILFVGDSWAFGMGESFEDSFPGQVALLAGRLGSGRTVESWPVALPGYNVLNQAAALEDLTSLLDPDVVVWCPTNNDISSSPTVGMRGFLERREAEAGEPFGDGMYRDFTVRFVDSYRYLSRWRRAAAEYRRIGNWLSSRDVPLVLLFTAGWNADWPEAIVVETGLRLPWAVAPQEWSSRDRRNAYNHATPDSNRDYARLAYRLVAQVATDWPTNATIDAGSQLPAVRVGSDRATGLSDIRSMDPVGERLPASYRPGPRPSKARGDQCSRTMSCESGEMGRRAAILLRRTPGAERIEIRLRRLAPAPAGLYPLHVRLEIPRFEDGTFAEVEISATGPAESQVSLALPASLEPGSAYEVEIFAERAALMPEVRELKSLVVAGIEAVN